MNFNMRYEGFYSEPEPIKGNSLKEVKLKIEKLGEYDRNYFHSNFRDYFSMKDRRWHRSKTKWYMHYSWNRVSNPLKFIMQNFLILSGYKERYDKWIYEQHRQHEIDQLNGKL